MLEKSSELGENEQDENEIQIDYERLIAMEQRWKQYLKREMEKDSMNIFDPISEDEDQELTKEGL